MDIEIEDALHDAINTIDFLHGCLTRPGLYKYAYPDQTLDVLTRLRGLVPERKTCTHSRLQPDACDSCAEHLARMHLREKGTNA